MTIKSDAQDRTFFLLTHTGRAAAIRSAERVVQGLLRCGIGVLDRPAGQRGAP